MFLAPFWWHLGRFGTTDQSDNHFFNAQESSRKLVTFREICRKGAPFRTSYARGLASGGGPGGGGSILASGGAGRGGSGEEVSLRTSLGIGDASGPDIP